MGKRGAATVWPVVSRPAMGCRFEVYLSGTDREALLGAGEAALDLVSEMDAQLSVYRPQSDLSRLNATPPHASVTLEPALYALLRRCDEWRIATQGAFDAGMGRLLRLWGFHDGEHRKPTDEQVRLVLLQCGAARLVWDDAVRSVTMPDPAIEVNLGAVGKGYALDMAAEALRRTGVRSAALHGGTSTIVAIGEQPGGGGWRFDLRDVDAPDRVLHTIRLIDQTVSTSADTEQRFVADGRRYGHIMDPRTGWPARGVRAVWVAGPCAAETDALSTAFNVLGPDAARDYLMTRPDLTAVFLMDGSDGHSVVIGNGHRGT